MSVPKSLQSALWSYDVKQLDASQDKEYIITQILNHGTWPQLKWLMRNYSTREIKNILRNPRRGLWFDDVLNFWLTIYGMKLPRARREKALFSLNPKPSYSLND